MKKSTKLWAFYRGVNVLVLASLVFYTSLLGVFFVPNEASLLAASQNNSCSNGADYSSEKDAVNIGDSSSEDDDHYLDGWSVKNLMFNSSGTNYGGGDDGTYRLVLEPTDIVDSCGKECLEENKSAFFKLNTGGEAANSLFITHLDGISKLDSFDVYVNNVYVDSYIDSGDNEEKWLTSPFPLDNQTGLLEIEIRLMDDIWDWCPIYGQLAISLVSLDTCSVCGDGKINSNEICDNGSENKMTCNPEYDSSCTYCSKTTCEKMTLEGGYCGDGIWDTSDEECDDGENNGLECEAGLDETCTYCSTECTTNTVIGPKSPSVESEEKEPVTNPVLTIVKSVEEGTYYPGDSVNYIVTIKNEGNKTAYDVRLDDTMPTGFTYDDGSGGIWSLGDLDANTEFNHIYSVTIGADIVAGSYTNTAEVSAENHDSITAKADVTVTARGVVLGAAVVAGEEDELPQAGAGFREYLFWLVALVWMAFGAYGFQKLELKNK